MFQKKQARFRKVVYHWMYLSAKTEVPGTKRCTFLVAFLKPHGQLKSKIMASQPTPPNVKGNNG